MQTRRFVFVLVRMPSDDVIAWLDENTQLVCADSAVKFNIWDVVSVVLSLTRSQAVDRIADRTAKKLYGSRDLGNAHF